MYHYRAAGREVGPIGVERLVDLFDSGAFGPDDEVRIDGTASWRRAADVVAAVRGRGGPRLPPVIPLVSAPPGPPPETRITVLVDGSLGPPDTLPATAPDAPAGGGVTLRAGEAPPAPVPAAPAGAGVTLRAGEAPPAPAAPFVIISEIPPTVNVVAPVPVLPSSIPPTLDVAGAGREESSPRVEPAPRPVREPVPGVPAVRALPEPRREDVRSSLAPGLLALLPRSTLLSAGGLLLGAVVVAVLFLRYTANLYGGPREPGSILREEIVVTMDAAGVTLKRGAHTAAGVGSFKDQRTRVTRVESASRSEISFPKVVLERTLTLDGEAPVVQTSFGTFHGDAVRVTSLGGSSEAEVVGRPPTENEKRALDAISVPRPSPYPDARLWPGRTFAVSESFGCDLLGIEADCKGGGTMEVVRFVKYRGARSAELSFRGQFEGRRWDALITATLDGTVYRALADAVDARAEIRGTLRSLGQIRAGRDGSALQDLTGSVEITLDSSLEEER